MPSATRADGHLAKAPSPFLLPSMSHTVAAPHSERWYRAALLGQS